MPTPKATTSIYHQTVLFFKAYILPMAAVTGLVSKPFIMLIISAFCNGDIRQQMTEAQSFAKFLNNGTL